jgi:hypothetical protein
MKKSKYLSTNIIIKKKKLINVLIPCPIKNCRGMIMEHDNKCCLCDCQTCFNCFHIIFDDNHKCLEENIETATEIRNNTKPCPNCAIRIFKISGCDQMWCTQCHTTVS